ncbi:MULTISPECIES: CopD family protein [Pseudomonas]|jgi:uncharacterized membrane protein|uniref:Copper resistance protein D domain-containing protein n=1 Tax=Pseudomonas marincola TaxID=437900 RepID=A0A1I6Y5B7_9PSED|nr:MULTISPECIES: CopD family protein [Pseudomonas]NRH29343.1 hypothetical protein [Pseudomonas sp. MS19]CAE6930987.1 Phosphoribosylcarboxyaminoimidazole (NCAIR) mutase [Pseudomonas marincola]SFT45441.1 Uncharacterized membrane protein [Pseudomonas marincola]
MTAYSALYALHVLAAMVWVGGMFFAWMILRPAAAGVLAAPERLQLWQEVFRRFFLWVWAAVLILPIGGMGMLHMRFAGFDTAPQYVQIMMGLFIAMLALFLRIQLLQLPELRKTIAEQNWSEAGAALARIRKVVGINLILGLLVVSIAAIRPSF